MDNKGTLFIPEEQTKQDTTDIDQYEEELKVRNYRKDVKYSLIQKNNYTFSTVYCSKCVTVFLNQTLILSFTHSSAKEQERK